MRQNIISQSEDFSNKQKARRLALYRRLSGVLLWGTILLGIGVIAAILFLSLGIALLLALGCFLTGITAVMSHVLSGADTSQLPWMQNAQWSIMNRIGHDKDDNHPD